MRMMTVLPVPATAGKPKLSTLADIQGDRLTYALYSNRGEMLQPPGKRLSENTRKAIASRYDTRVGSSSDLNVFGLREDEVGAVETYKLHGRKDRSIAVPRHPLLTDPGTHIDRGVYTVHGATVYFSEETRVSPQILEGIAHLRHNRRYVCLQTARGVPVFYCLNGPVVEAISRFLVPVEWEGLDQLRAAMAGDGGVPRASEAIVQAYLAAASLNSLIEEAPKPASEAPIAEPSESRKTHFTALRRPPAEPSGPSTHTDSPQSARNETTERAGEPETEEGDSTVRRLEHLLRVVSRSIGRLTRPQAVSKLQKVIDDSMAAKLVQVAQREHIELLADQPPVQQQDRASAVQYLTRHGVAVSILAMASAMRMKSADEELKALAVSALHQDVSFLRDDVLRGILAKQRCLTPSELGLLFQHPQASAAVVRGTEACIGDAYQMILHSHERPNGSGYPLGLKGNEIHDLARLLTVADTYVALVSPRPYRPALRHEHALELIKRQAKSGLLDRSALKVLESVLR